MANIDIQGTPIGQLSPLGSITGDEKLPVETGSGNGFVTASQIKKYVADNIYDNATPSSDGLMSKEDKVKLNSALTGDGVSSVKVVTEMPGEPEGNVLYIVTGEG